MIKRHALIYVLNQREHSGGSGSVVLNLPESPHTNRVVRYGQHSTKLGEAKVSTSGGK